PFQDPAETRNAWLPMRALSHPVLSCTRTWVSVASSASHEAPGNGGPIMEELPSLGALFRHYRLAAGLTQEALAERAELSVRLITDLERDVGHRPRKATLARLATALQLLEPEREQLEAIAHRQGKVAAMLASREARSHAPGPVMPPLVGRRREL